MEGYKISELSVGQKASTTKTISEADVYGFAGIVGDFNPVHVNEEFAKTTRFGKRIAHGILSAGLISSTLAMKLPGPGNVYIRQDLKFTAPVFIGDTITATVEITQVIPDRNRIILSTVCTNQDGVEVIRGEAEVSPRK